MAPGEFQVDRRNAGAKKNIEYAASFLLTLYKKYGDWHQAVRFYHSSTAEYYRKYSRKITLAWIGV